MCGAAASRPLAWARPQNGRCKHTEQERRVEPQPCTCHGHWHRRNCGHRCGTQCSGGRKPSGECAWSHWHGLHGSGASTGTSSSPNTAELRTVCVHRFGFFAASVAGVAISTEATGAVALGCANVPALCSCARLHQLWQMRPSARSSPRRRVLAGLPCQTSPSCAHLHRLWRTCSSARSSARAQA
jgi:hypothetical protein